jgi:diguanylate cyclase (GGDEF)-like protein/PAS domain S-box-containing protein
MNAFALFLEGIPLPAWMTDETGVVRAVNDRWREFTEGDTSDVAPGSAFDPVIAEDRSALEQALAEATQTKAAFQLDIQVRRDDGQYRWMTCVASPYHNPSGELLGFIGMCLDLTERRQREERLAYMATHDSLTGLPNRRMFEGALDRAVARTRRGVHSVLLVLDIDNFKSFNDALGHLNGDQALSNFAFLLQRHVRAGDLLARIGGDEFAVLFEDTSMENAAEVAERMRVAAVEEEFVSHARAHELSLSGGLVPVEGSLDAREVFDHADAVMYEAKERGRNRVIVARPEVSVTDHTTRVAAQVRAALAEERFVLYFQPVVQLEGGVVAYYESLVRMIDEAGEMRLPAEFLTTIDRLGLMPRLTRIVVGLAIAALAAYDEVSISINVSASDLSDDSLPAFIHEQLVESGVGAERMVFEMSESVVVGNLSSAGSWVERLGGLGCAFVLDGFGAGLGLFGLLRELPFEQVKLDGSIVAALVDGGDSRRFIEAVRQLIEAQGRIAVAAWVDSEELLSSVEEAGFSLAQGYQLHVPTPDLGALVQISPAPPTTRT